MKRRRRNDPVVWDSETPPAFGRPANPAWTQREPWEKGLYGGARVSQPSRPVQALPAAEQTIPDQKIIPAPPSPVARVRSHLPKAVIGAVIVVGTSGTVATVWIGVDGIFAINGLPWEAVAVIYSGLAGILARLFRERKKAWNILVVRWGSLQRWTQSLTP